MKRDKEILLRAFEDAKGWSVLLVTISTGSILFTGVFRDSFTSTDSQLEGRVLLVASWISLGISVLAGLSFIGRLFAILSLGREESLNLYDRTAQLTAVFQLFGFVLGISLIMAFVLKNLF